MASLLFAIRKVLQLSPFVLIYGLLGSCSVDSSAGTKAKLKLNPFAPGFKAPKTINLDKVYFEIKKGDNIGPGPNSFSNVGIVLKPDLILKTNLQGSHWHSSEIRTTKPLGYGTYEFRIKGDFKNFDPNTVFGAFLYDYDDLHEVDLVEISKWGKKVDLSMCLAC